MARPGVTRITADLPNEDVQRLGAIADKIGSNRTTALSRALRTSAILEQATQNGSRVEIVDKDGSRREIILP